VGTYKGGARGVRRVPASKARAHLAEILDAVGDGHMRILIERRGKSPVALVSADELLRYQLLEARHQRTSPRRG
jgi:prevent-host-death family protein